MEYFLHQVIAELPLNKRTGYIWMVFPNSVSGIPETNLY